jgi:type III secretion protein R
MTQSDPVTVALFIASLSLLPMLLICTTSFLKTSVVLMIARNAMGVQQVPPAMALYAIAMMLTVFAMAPTFLQMSDAINTLNQERAYGTRQPSLIDTVGRVAEPLRGFMLKYAKEDEREIFLEKAKQLWPKKAADEATSRDFVILVPSFIVSELQAGFQMGFLIYIPFLVIDLIVSNLLLALGMQMVSPMTVSLPLKLFLFVTVDGWGKLLNAILNTYM